MSAPGRNVRTPGICDEGVVKFRADHTEGPLDAVSVTDGFCRLGAWRTVLHRMGLVGQALDRYGGAGYGNVSCRVRQNGCASAGTAFCVSGTQTGGQVVLGSEGYCCVSAYDYAQNWVRSAGPCRPSSESLTHAAVYDAGAQINWVFHVHSPELWRAANELRIPLTSPSVAYGTPEMALEVLRLFSTASLGTMGVFAMGGHEDGIVGFGCTADEAGQVIMRYLVSAYDSAYRQG